MLVPIGLLLVLIFMGQAAADVDGQITLVRSEILPGHYEGTPVYQIYNPWYGYAYFEYLENFFVYQDPYGAVFYYEDQGWNPAWNWVPLDPQLMQWRLTPFQNY